MVALNILFVLLGFINSINKGRKVDVTQQSIGEIVLSDGPEDPLTYC
jgi:hypothetical protein